MLAKECQNSIAEVSYIREGEATIQGFFVFLFGKLTQEVIRMAPVDAQSITEQAENQEEERQDEQYLEEIVQRSMQKLNAIALSNGTPLSDYLSEEEMRIIFYAIQGEGIVAEAVEDEEKQYELCLNSLVESSLQKLNNILLSNGKKISDHLSEEQLKTIFREVYEEARCAEADRLRIALQEVQVFTPYADYTPLGALKADEAHNKRENSIPVESAPLPSPGKVEEKNTRSHFCSVT